MIATLCCCSFGGWGEEQATVYVYCTVYIASYHVHVPVTVYIAGYYIHVPVTVYIAGYYVHPVHVHVPVTVFQCSTLHLILLLQLSCNVASSTTVLDSSYTCTCVHVQVLAHSMQPKHNIALSQEW